MASTTASITVGEFQSPDNADNISSALEDLTANELHIRSGSISASDAHSLRKLLLSPLGDIKQWCLALSSCYPEDDEAFESLRTAFSKCAVNKFIISQFDTANQDHQRMLDCIFGTLPERRKIIFVFYFHSCSFGADTIRSISAWIKTGEVVAFVTSHASVKSFEGGSSAFVAGVFEGNENKPMALSFQESPDGHDKIGDLSQFQSWESLRIVTLHNLDPSNVSGLLSLTQVPWMVFEYNPRRLSSDVDALGELLRDDRSKLLVLMVRADNGSLFGAIEGRREEERFALSLFSSLTSNSALQVLEYRPWNFGDAAADALIRCLEKNDALKRLQLSRALVDVCPNFPDRLAEVLSSKNSSLERIDFDDGSVVETAPRAMACAFRNWAGRRLLPQQHDTPRALWPLVFSRIRPSAVNVSEWDGSHWTDGLIYDSTTNHLCADSIYHLVRGISSIFVKDGGGKEKRMFA